MARNTGDKAEPRFWALTDRTVVAPQTLRAREMRRIPTEAEKKLWWHLHRLSLPGSHFRRQVRLGPYIVDFASHRARVVIEVDGGQHVDETNAARTKFIEAQGYRVLRFWNNEVLGNVEGVLQVVQGAINGRPARGDGTAVLHSPTPTPDPSPQGGGEQSGGG